MAKQAKAFKNLDNKVKIVSKTPKSEFIKSGSPIVQYNNRPQEKSQPKKPNFVPKERVDQNKKNLNKLFSYALASSLVFKIFNTKGETTLPTYVKICKVFNKDTNEPTFYLVDINTVFQPGMVYPKDNIIQTMVSYPDSNISFKLSSGAIVVTEQHISRKFVDAAISNYSPKVVKKSVATKE